MHRLTFKLLLLALPATLCLAPLAHAETAKRPNVLFIVADDLGYSDTQPFGSEISTPSIQKLADDGVRLKNLYAGPTCSVTRSMLLTGVDNHQAGLGTMAEYLQPEQKGKNGYEGYLNQRVTTLAEQLKDNGYNTFMAGKWHLGMLPQAIPSARGFEHSFVLLPGGASHMDMRPMFPGNYLARYLEDGKEVQLPKDFYSSDFYTDRMLDYLQKQREPGKPFFGYLAFTAPHWPLQAPDEYLEKYRGHYQEGYEQIRQQRLARMKQLGLVSVDTQANVPLAERLPNWDQLTEAQREEQARIMSVYAAMVDNLDHNIGRVVEYLRKTGELDNTFIVFMSDNGSEASSLESLGTTDDHGGIQEWVDKNFDNRPQNQGRQGSYLILGPQWAQVGMTPFPYFKSLTARGGINVPAIVRYPGWGKPGQINDQLLHVKDLMPTVLELAHVSYPSQRNGHDLLPLQGRSMRQALQHADKPQAERALGWEFNGRRALYKGNWTILMQAPPYGTGHWQLFDYVKDPSLLHDLATETPGKVAELAADWDEYAKSNGVISAPIRYRYGQMTCLYGRCVQ